MSCVIVLVACGFFVFWVERLLVRSLTLMVVCVCVMIQTFVVLSFFVLVGCWCAVGCLG